MIDSNSSEITNAFAFRTVLAEAKIRGIKLNQSEASRIGRYASKKGRDNNIPPKEVPDLRYGSVKSHHVAILKEAFKKIMGL